MTFGTICRCGLARSYHGREGFPSLDEYQPRYSCNVPEHAALASSPAPAGLDDFGTWVRWLLDANPNAEPADLIAAIKERMAP